ncbi:MAG: endonuclease V [Halorientalis sp.]
MTAHPEFAPDPSLSRSEMEALQRRIADEAVFADDVAYDPQAACPEAADGQRHPSDTDSPTARRGDGEPPVVVGVDQAFIDDDRAVSALVALQGGEVIERVSAVEPVEIPYIPGLLSFREGAAILAGFEALSVTPDLALLDGSGRIHYREAGLATHVGVMLDLPALGVAKSLLCGTPDGTTEGLAAGERVPIVADEDVTATEGTVLGYAVQTRQFDSPDRHVNPVYVSPGHRLSAETAADVALSCAAGYKLPQPTRLADQHADAAKADLR